MIEAKGHAETAPEGKDLLCAAVSSQMMGFARAVKAVGEPRIKSGKICVDFGDGVVDVIAATGKVYKKIETYLVPVEEALEAYKKAFPEAIKILRNA